MKIHTHPHSHEQRTGTATVEFAVCLPVLILLTFATIQATQMMYLKQTLTVAAYEGIRKAVHYRTSAGEVNAACTRILADRGVQGAAINITPNNYVDADPESWITVTVTAPCNLNSPLRGWFYSDRSLTSSATFMKEF